jgi:glutamate racemase
MEALPAPVGIFDSGIGGLSILKALRAELPGESFVYLADNAHAPYGERGDAFVTERTLAITQFLRAKHQIKALVIACNTATAAAIHHVRAAHPDLPVVGVEPALKPAVQASKTKRIGVMATRGTVESAKFQALVTSLQGQAEFIVHPCDGLAAAIEQTGLQADLLNATNIRAICERHTRAIGLCDAKEKTMDTLVLGCTHYPFAAEMLQALMGQGVQLIDNGAAVARQTRRLLANAAHLSPHNHGLLTLLATGETTTLGIAATNSLPSPQAPLTENVIQVTC